ncbi:flagellar hook protein FlgE [Tolumonas lignilytica]|jgi:fagellar hook-basal body proteins|uniref:flagellar hook protein FlgE n=1 Tax=Tolumonas lignilytica TaxID=1283284 RepID=UPI000466A905|nr:flagellar hook protein FlgE [Tolumonas lignilytica]
MSFNISLSGLNAAQKDLDVTGNNIANASSIGFKKSRAEFEDVFSNSVFANTKTQVGSGVNTAAVSQQFAQGALQSTSNSLDLAIKGDGFFVLSPTSTSLERTYTRAGAMQVNDAGYVTNANGDYLQVYQVNSDGTPKAVSLDSTTALQIPTVAGQPKPTTTVTAGLNLPAGASVNASVFNPADSSTYTSSTSAVLYDSLGQSHTMTQYYVKTATSATDSTWVAHVYVDGTVADTAGAAGTTLKFDTTGTLTSPNPATITTVPLTMLTNGADQTQTVTLKFNPVTQYASSFQVTSMSQDGATVGQLTNVSIGSDGVVAATYSNGTTTKLGMVALAKFSNPQGLTQIGDTSWKESQDSGSATPGIPNTGTYGSINSSALESSNTDLSAELVNLIAAQRNYQANSRALEVNSTLQDNILQIR